MSTENIDIRISTTGARQAQTEIAGLGTAAEASAHQTDLLSHAMSHLKQILAAAGVALTIEHLVHLSDVYVELQNQLKLVTANTAELRDVEQQLFDISQRTTTGFRSNVEIYAQLRQGAAQYGLGVKETIDLTNRFAQALDASGKGSEEASSAIRQLARGIAQGRLESRALIGVFDQLPLVTRAIADGLNVPIARLKEMAQAGTLTGRDLIQALQRTDLIARASAQKIDTIKDAWGNVTNALLRYVGQMDHASGVGEVLVHALIVLAANLSLILNSLIVAGTAWLAFQAATFAAAFATEFMVGVTTQLAGTSAAAALGVTSLSTAHGVLAIATRVAALAVTSLIGVIRGLFLLILANPFVALVTILTGAVVAIYQFGDSIKIGGVSALTLLRAAMATVMDGLRLLGAILIPVGTFFKTVWTEVSKFTVSLIGSEAAIRFMQGALIALGVVLTVTIFPTLAAVLSVVYLLGEAITVISGGAIGDFTNRLIALGKALKDDFVKNMHEANHENQNFVGSLADVRQAVSSTARTIEYDMGTAAELHKKYMDEINKSYTDAINKMHELQRATDELAKTTRNAFGDMIAVESEWARRSGEYFNKTKAGASSAADTLTAATSRMSDGYNSVSSAASSATAAMQGTLTVIYQTASSVEGATLGLLQAMQNIQKLNETPVGTSQLDQLQRRIDLLAAKNALAAAVQTAEFNTGNQGGFADVGKAQRDTGIQGLIDQARNQYGIPRFAGGGSFDIGGPGGVDSQLIQFYGSPGERVTVETPQQQRSSTGGKSGNIYVTVVAKDVDSFRRSEPQLLTNFAGKLRSVAGGGRS